MSRQLKFQLQTPEVEQDYSTDLVEINLNPSCGQTKSSSSAQALDQLLLATPPHRGYPYGYAEDSEPETYFCRKSNSTGQLAEKVSPPPPAATNISCLRQMYCPECNERLHEQGVRLERLLTMCCFAMLPLYPCCPRRTNNDCRVICGKCGYLLGAWKRQ